MPSFCLLSLFLSFFLLYSFNVYVIILHHFLRFSGFFFFRFFLHFFLSLILLVNTLKVSNLYVPDSFSMNAFKLLPSLSFWIFVIFISLAWKILLCVMIAFKQLSILRFWGFVFFIYLIRQWKALRPIKGAIKPWSSALTTTRAKRAASMWFEEVCHVVICRYRLPYLDTLVEKGGVIENRS